MKIIAGNWKMNGSRPELDAMIAAIEPIQTKNKVIICVPFTMLGRKSDKVEIGAQDLSSHEGGAFTGEVSAKMLVDTGVKYVIVGHSERRQNHAETNEIVKQKAERAIAAGLTPIICVGETLEQKKLGQTFEIIQKQIQESTKGLSSYILAYEPIWAISAAGTGLTPTSQDIANIHEFIRKLTPAGLLYGGSVKGGTAAEIMSIKNVDGVFVGGASLKPGDFIPIIESV